MLNIWLMVPGARIACGVGRSVSTTSKRSSTLAQAYSERALRKSFSLNASMREVLSTCR